MNIPYGIALVLLIQFAVCSSQAQRMRPTPSPAPATADCSGDVLWTCDVKSRRCWLECIGEASTARSASIDGGLSGMTVTTGATGGDEEEAAAYQSGTEFVAVREAPSIVSSADTTTRILDIGAEATFGGNATAVDET